MWDVRGTVLVFVWNCPGIRMETLQLLGFYWDKHLYNQNWDLYICFYPTKMVQTNYWVAYRYWVLTQKNGVIMGDPMGIRGTKFHPLR